jgi:hypothetical protein
MIIILPLSGINYNKVKNMEEIPVTRDIGQGFGISYLPLKVEILAVTVKYKMEENGSIFYGTHNWIERDDLEHIKQGFDEKE